MMCNRFNFIHASLVSAKKLNTHPLPVKNDHHSMNSCLLGCLINDYTCTLRGYLAKQKFFGTKNTKQIPLFTTSLSLSGIQKKKSNERFFERLCKLCSPDFLCNQMLNRASKDCQI